MNAAETWARFDQESQACSSRLTSKLRESMQSLQELLRCQADTLDNALKTNAEAINLDLLDNIFNARAQSLLLGPLEKYRRDKPQQRVTEAVHDWDTAMEGVIGAMPEFLTMSASEWIALVGNKDMNLRARLRLTLSRRTVRVSIRQNLLYGFHVHRTKRLRLEGRLMRVIAESSMELIVPWQSVIQAWLPHVLTNNGDFGSATKDLGELRRRIGALEKQMASILSDFGNWTVNASRTMANIAPFRRDVTYGKGQLDDLSRDYFRHRNFWVRQSRAVESDIDLERKLRVTEREVTRTAREVLTGIEKEHRELLSELEAVVTWLGTWKRSERSSFPPAVANVVSAVNRLDSWTNSIDAILDYIPETVEVPARIRARPPWRQSFRTQAPRAVCRESFKRQGEAVIRDGLDHLERQHRSIVREIERAREVVAFASEMAQVGKAEDLQVEREGIENARSLLEFHRTQTQVVPPEVERSLVSAVAAGFLRTHTMLEAGQFGVARQAARHGLPAAVRKFATQAGDTLRKGAKAVGRSSAEFYRELLIRIGWIPAPTARIPHVITRGYLSYTLGAESRLDEMPMIYQRLFRLTPVEDPRFLIGRQHEMNALAEARRLWEADRESAVMIVGERGSGKTSLLNCAVQSPLRGLEIIRSDFSERLTRRDEMYEFLGGLLKTEPDSVETTLKAGKRVMILEELERTYLRRVNRFEAIRTLLNLISKTSKHTLWIISTNYFAFRLLNATLRLDPHFSHRVNAMSVDQSHLREAVLLRHNLSGLRLQFAPPPRQDGYAQRIRKLAGVEAEPESDFFDALYRESGGVFRTAFALWQRYIDRAEAGILYMRYPSTPHYEGIIKSLNDLDLFTLAAILQHGSLTPAEHSIIFQIDEAKSNAWLDNLLARELIQPDPGRSGFRVVPEAGEVVRRTLFNRNVA